MLAPVKLPRGLSEAWAPALYAGRLTLNRTQSAKSNRQIGAAMQQSSPETIEQSAQLGEAANHVEPQSVPGARAQSALILCTCTWFQAAGTWYQPGTRNLVPRPGCRYLVPGARSLVPGTRYHVPGARYPAPGTRYLVPM